MSPPDYKELVRKAKVKSMKKNLLAWGILCSLLLAGCGSQTATESVDQNAVGLYTKEELEGYVSLGEYKGIQLEKVNYTISNDRVQEKMQEVLEDTAQEIGEDETIQEGDIVTLDYEGLVDGEILEDGQVTDYDLKIGSGEFIEGFEEGLIGAKAGEERTLELTFPEDYAEEDLAGRDVTFEVTSEEVRRPQESIDEEWVQENTNYETVKDYKTSIRNQLKSSADSAATEQLESDAWEAVYNNTEFLGYPDGLVDEYIEMQEESYQVGADYYEMDYDELLESYGMTQEDVEKDAEKIVENELISAAICEKEGITEESSLYQEKLEELLQENYYDSYEEAVEDGIEEKNILRTVQYYCALDIILENAQITEIEETL